MSHQKTGPAGPLHLVDLLKALACVLIVLHHLAFYGPMADYAAPVFPGFFAWAADSARMAVQVFLVVGGFLAARGLWDGLQPTGRSQALVGRVVQRYLRLAVPLWAAVLFVALSAWGFNRDARWDIAAPYHWASYGLGVLVGLSTRMPTRSRVFLAAAVLVALSLWVEFRPRLIVALLTAAVLWVGMQGSGKVLPSLGMGVQGLGRISYSVLLIHFPVCLVINALWTVYLPPSAWLQLLGVVTAFKLSLLAGWLFHRFIEEPATHWVAQRVALPRGDRRASGFAA